MSTYDQVLQLSDTLNSEWQRYHGTLADGGPVYAETDLSMIIPEPWNALSSLLILAPALYWAWRLRGEYRKYAFLSFCMPLLFLGGLGSTLFHAFRASSFLLLMDVLPTALLTLSVMLFLWYKLLGKWQYLAIILLVFVGLQVAVRYVASPHTAINLSYFITGTLIFLPVLLILIRTHWQHLLQIGGALFFFVLSLFFREIDAWEESLLPMGTHWLWHVSTGVGAFLLAEYLYFLYPLDAGLKFKKRKLVS